MCSIFSCLGASECKQTDSSLFFVKGNGVSIKPLNTHYSLLITMNLGDSLKRRVQDSLAMCQVDCIFYNGCGRMNDALHVFFCWHGTVNSGSGSLHNKIRLQPSKSIHILSNSLDLIDT